MKENMDMEQLHRISIILPSYNPTAGILAVIQHVIKQGFNDVIVVDDGSKGALSPIFDDVAKIPCCTVLKHDVNRGKGAALKTGMAFFRETRPDSIGIITIDDDGQHLPEDIKRCALAMAESGAIVLGARDFRAPGVPLKSRIGNRLTAWLFRIWIHLDISDTQTGLRAIPGKCIDALIVTEGDRFEYETNMLITAKKERFIIAEVPISTVYIDGNKNTHFRAFADSFGVIAQLAKYALSSILSFGVDLVSFYALVNLLGGYLHTDRGNVIFFSTIIARALSSSVNFLLNKNIVFRSAVKDLRKAALKYYTLCGASVILSGFLVSLLVGAASIQSAFFTTLVKVAADSLLFIMNYHIQKKWVYV